jgi:DNA-binding response OmpR family regulator
MRKRINWKNFDTDWGDSMRILLVEDDNTIALGLEYALSQEGYSVLLCRDAASGSKALKEQKFNLCLFDLTLPDGSGYDLCKLARERFDTPVIILTACDEEVNVVMGLELGADDYITKPFRVRELLARIKTVLRRYGRDNSTKNISSWIPYELTQWILRFIETVKRLP